MYSEKLLDHFHHARNVGEIDEPTAVAEVANPICGDSMKLWILVRDGRVLDAKFKVQGCVPAVACASWLTDSIKSRGLSEIKEITAQQVESGLGGLPVASRHASTLVIDALKQAIEKLRA